MQVDDFEATEGALKCHKAAARRSINIVARTGGGAARQRRQPRPLPRLEQDLADALAAQAASSIGNVRLRAQQKAAAVAAEEGARSGGKAVGRRGKLRVQVCGPLQQSPVQEGAGAEEIVPFASGHYGCPILSLAPRPGDWHRCRLLSWPWRP